MTWTAQILVLARDTASSRALLDAMTSRAERAPTQFTLLVPGGRAQSRADLEVAVGAMRERDLSVRLLLGERDPIVAVRDAWSPGLYDEIIVSTLPLASSKWLLIDLPSRVARLTGASVTHVVAGGGPLRPDVAALAPSGQKSPACMWP